MHEQFFRPSSDLSSNTSIHSHRSNIDRQSELTSKELFQFDQKRDLLFHEIGSRTSSTNSMNTAFKPSTTSSPQKTPIELREEVPHILSCLFFFMINFS